MQRDNKTESLQHSFTKNIGTLRNLTNPELLDILHAESLEIRRLKFDLIMIFRIIHGHCALDSSSFLHCTTLVREVINY